MIRKIEIDFALSVDLSDEERRALDKLVGHICKRSCPEGWAFWPAGIGDKPMFSQADARFLGKQVDPNAPASGEPTFDDSVFHIDCAARKLSQEEIETRNIRATAAAVARARWDSRLAGWLHRRGFKRASWWVADLSIWMRRKS